MEVLRKNFEDGAASLQRYLVSIQIRSDTKIFLVLGILVGVGIITLISAFPGKPIDYSGAGFNVPAGLRGGRVAPDEEHANDKKNGNQGGTETTHPAQEGNGGVRELQGLVDNMSELRRRKGKRRTQLAGADVRIAEGRKSNGEEIGVENQTGDWDASRVDEDKLAQKIGQSKAARMLGLTEEQVRLAVLDAKKEMRDGAEGSGSISSSGQLQDDGGVGFSGMLSLVLLILGLGALWLFLSEYPHGPLARFLVGAFPREMETLGLYKQGGKVVRDAIAADVGRPD